MFFLWLYKVFFCHPICCQNHKCLLHFQKKVGANSRAAHRASLKLEPQQNSSRNKNVFPSILASVCVDAEANPFRDPSQRLSIYVRTPYRSRHCLGNNSFSKVPLNSLFIDPFKDNLLAAAQEHVRSSCPFRVWYCSVYLILTT